MSRLWSSLFRKAGEAEQRMTVNDWMNQAFTYQGQGYPVMGTSPRGVNSESIENDFIGYVKGAYKSDGVVFACMVARQYVFSEARFAFQDISEGRPGDRFNDSELDVLAHPWPNGTTGELLSRAIQDADLAGNHYVVRENDRLRRLRPDWVDIILTAPPDQAVESDVAGYLYRPGGTQDRDLWKLYPIDGSQGEIAHWTPIPDPEAQYRGMSWLTPIMREIVSDKAATLHKSKFFENAATPNLAVSFKETVTKEQFDGFMRAMNDAHKGVDHAYSTMYLGGGADVQVVGADMRQLDLKVSQGAGETRIAAAAQVHPVVVGLSEGMQGSSLNAGNFKAAKDIFADKTLRPLWRSISAAYESLLIVPENSRLWFDDRDIAFLLEDRVTQADIRQKESATINALVMNGFTHESVMLAVQHEDWRLLEHTGLFSVQLQPPNDTNNDGEIDNVDTDGDGKPNVSKGAPKQDPATGGGTGAAPASTGTTPKAGKKKPAAPRPASKPKPKP